MIDRPLPQNKDTEEYILGCLLIENQPFIRQYASRLSHDDFYYPPHKVVLRNIQKVIIDGKDVDLLSISRYMPKAENILFELMNSVPTSANIDTHIAILKDYTAQRKSIEITCNFFEGAYESMSISDDIRALISSLQIINLDSNKQNAFTTKETIEEIQQMIEKATLGEVNHIVPYCIPGIDSKIKHMRKQMHVLAAESGIGKTAWGMSCFDKQAKKGLKVAFLCGESSRHELMIRRLCMITGKPFMYYAQGMPDRTEADLNHYQIALQDLHTNNESYWIYGKGDYDHSVEGIYDVVAELTSRHGRLDMVYFDYLQNMRPMAHMKKETNRTAIVETNVMELNNLIGEFNIAGVVLCQLNREAAKRGRPRMDNLKYASTIENEAHNITFLFREKTELAKNGILETEWYSDKTRIQEKIRARLAFIEQKAEYMGMLSAMNE